MAALADVVLRGLGLCGQALALGGVLFIIVVLRPQPWSAAHALASRRAWALVAVGATSAAAAHAVGLALLLLKLEGDGPGHVRLLASTAFAQVSGVNILASLALAATALVVRRRRRIGGVWAVLLVAMAASVVSAGWTGHGAARLHHRPALTTLDALHQLGATAWIGGLAHLLVATRGPGSSTAAVLRRFSGLSLTAVAVLVAAGLGLTLAYVDGIPALLATAYGLMILTKILILGGLLLLGAANFRVVRRVADPLAEAPHRLRRLVEVELGLGITVLFVAGSLTSLPPAIDVTADRPTLEEVSARFTPRWPRLTSPPIDQLPIDNPEAPRTDADRAWSEYNHHVAGLCVLAMGALAILHVSGRAPWARQWPLVLLGLAGFMLLRNDPGAWPLGPLGFWESMAVPSVLQHRAFVLLVVMLAVFEWMVRAHRIRSPRAALVFPLLCVVGGGLLLTHSHTSPDLRSEFLIEVAHAPLGLLAIVIGWARWLELRLATPDDRVPSRVWASALAVFGILLLLYRER